MIWRACILCALCISCAARTGRAPLCTKNHYSRSAFRSVTAARVWPETALAGWTSHACDLARGIRDSAQCRKRKAADAKASRGRQDRTGAGVRFCQGRGRTRATMWACVLCPPCTAWAAHLGRARRFSRNHKSGGVCWVATATRVSVGLEGSNRACAFASGKTQ